MPRISQKEASAYDRMMDAAGELAHLIESYGIEMDEYALEELTIFLASNAKQLRQVTKKLKVCF